CISQCSGNERLVLRLRQPSLHLPKPSCRSVPFFRFRGSHTGAPCREPGELVDRISWNRPSGKRAAPVRFGFGELLLPKVDISPPVIYLMRIQTCCVG